MMPDSNQRRDPSVKMHQDIYECVSMREILLPEFSGPLMNVGQFCRACGCSVTKGVKVLDPKMIGKYPQGVLVKIDRDWDYDGIINLQLVCTECAKYLGGKSCSGECDFPEVGGGGCR